MNHGVQIPVAPMVPGNRFASGFEYMPQSPELKGEGGSVALAAYWSVIFGLHGPFLGAVLGDKPVGTPWMKWADERLRSYNSLAVKDALLIQKKKDVAAGNEQGVLMIDRMLEAQSWQTIDDPVARLEFVQNWMMVDDKAQYADMMAQKNLSQLDFIRRTASDVLDIKENRDYIDNLYQNAAYWGSIADNQRATSSPMTLPSSTSASARTRARFSGPASLIWVATSRTGWALTRPRAAWKPLPRKRASSVHRQWLT